jgi:hypothetical protein
MEGSVVCIHLHGDLHGFVLSVAKIPKNIFTLLSLTVPSKNRAVRILQPALGVAITLQKSSLENNK